MNISLKSELELLHYYGDLRNQRIKQLNQAIEVGLIQLNEGKKSLAKASYDKLKKKIDEVAQK